MWFHYPKGKTPQYTNMRQEITNQYGDYTLIMTVIVLFMISIINTLIKSGVYIQTKFNIFKVLTKFEDSWFIKPLKHIIFFILFHLSTIIQVTLWGTILGVLSLMDLNDGDLIYLAKRLGKVADTCLPTILFLSLRPSPLPHTLYLALIPIHKWLSRLVIIQSVLHTLLYLGYFQHNNTWAKALKPENIHGWVALACFLLILITSLSRFRNRFYKIFYMLHYSLTWIIVICLQFHVRPVKSTVLTTINFAILIGQIGYRIKLTTISQPQDVKINNISPNLLLVEFPRQLISKPGLNPGSHIRLTKFNDNILKRWFNHLIPNYHPYTLVSLPNDFKQKLIIKKGQFQFHNGDQYLITGSYDAKLLFIDNPTNKFQISKLTFNTKRILIVIGGSAISFALPIVRVMNYHGIPTKIVWVIKDFRDVAVLKYFDGYIHGPDFEIFITGDDSIDSSSAGAFSNVPGSLSERESEIGLPATETTALLDSRRKSFGAREKDFEDENVDIETEFEEDNDDDCNRTETSLHIMDSTDRSSDNSSDGESINSNETTNSLPSQRTTISNEQFIPRLKSSSDLTQNYLDNYLNTIGQLNLVNRVYKGRPKLNHRYYNWCLYEGFTQCSGPVAMNGELVCCKDLPRNNIIEGDISKVWVVAAGPKGLVNNVKVWAQENGLKFHEEAFYT